MYELRPAAEALRAADAILIGASNGLSIAEGLHLFADNTAFSSLFGNFKGRYGLTCLLQGMAGRWPSEEERWAFWGRLLHHYCGQYRPTTVMQDLKAGRPGRLCPHLQRGGTLCVQRLFPHNGLGAGGQLAGHAVCTALS